MYAAQCAYIVDCGWLLVYDIPLKIDMSASFMGCVKQFMIEINCY